MRFSRLAALPVLAIVAVLLREPIVEVIDRAFGLAFVFNVVELVSSLWIRFLVWLAASVALIGAAILIWWASGRRMPSILLALAATLPSFAILFITIGPRRSVLVAAVIGVIVYVNSLPAHRFRALLDHPRFGRWLDGLFQFGVGIELILPRPFFIWIRNGPVAVRQDAFIRRLLPAALLGSAVLSLALPFSTLMHWDRKLFLSPHAKIVFGAEYRRWSRFDVSDMAWDAVNRRLFLCGDSQKTVKMLDVASGEVIDSGLNSAGNEFCEFDSKGNRFLTAESQTRSVVMADGANLADWSAMPLPDMPPGEIFLALFPNDGVLAFASENEGMRDAAPEIRLIDLDQRSVLCALDADVGFILSHPDEPILYVNHFGYDMGVHAFDIHACTKRGESVKFGRSDRMAFDRKRNEVLATAPVSGRIYRLDGETLESRGHFNTIFGARGIAVDSERDLLLVSSFLMNRVDVIDLATGRSLRRYRLGPWLRDIVLTDEPGIAYVASRYAVYRLDYMAD